MCVYTHTQNNRLPAKALKLNFDIHYKERQRKRPYIGEELHLAAPESDALFLMI